MPFLRFAFSTPLSPRQVASRLAFITSIEPSWWSRRNGCSATFFGTVGESSFKLRRNVDYRNSFLPTIYGVVSDDTAGTRIKVSMYLHPLVALFMMVWFGGLGFGAVEIAAAEPFALHGPAAIPMAMVVFGIAMTVCGFFPEAFIAKRIIKKTLMAG